MKRFLSAYLAFIVIVHLACLPIYADDIFDTLNAVEEQSDIGINESEETTDTNNDHSETDEIINAAVNVENGEINGGESGPLENSDGEEAEGITAEETEEQNNGAEEKPTDLTENSNDPDVPAETFNESENLPESSKISERTEEPDTPPDDSCCPDFIEEESDPDPTEPKTTDPEPSYQELTDAVLEFSSCSYTGKEQKPSVTVYASDCTKQLVNGEDYEVKYGKNINAGQASVTIVGKGGYCGTLKMNFTINPVPLTSVAMPHDALVYDGTPRTMTNGTVVKAKMNGKTIVLNRKTDYKVSYQNNTGIGTAVMTVTGKNNFSGTITKKFKIVGKIASVWIPHSSMTYTGTARTMTKAAVVKAVVDSKEQILVRDQDYKISYKNNINAGTATMIVTGKGFYTGTVKKQFKITPVSLKSASLAYSSKFYNGSLLKPAAEVKAKVNNKEIILTKNKNYTITYSNNKNPGTATAVIKGTGNFRGTIKKTFKIRAFQISGSGNARTMTVAPAADYSNVRIAVWTVRKGQNDLTWYTLKQTNNGCWKGKFYLRNLIYDGKCTVDIYDGNNIIASASFTAPREDWLNAKADEFKKKWLHGSDSAIDYIQAAINIARDNSIGYGHTYPKTISCAGLVGLCLTFLGYGDFIKDDPLEWRYCDLGPKYGYEQEMEAIGAKWHPGTNGLKPGDILYWFHSYSSNHIGFYVGNGLSVEARGPEGNEARDSSGREVAVYSDWGSLGWQGYWRLPEIHYR